MINLPKACHLVLLPFLLWSVPVQASVQIPPGDPGIEVDGALIVRQADDSLQFQRFTDNLLERKRTDGSVIFKSYYNEFKAKTSSGITLRFTTGSPTVEIHLREVPEDNRGHEVGVIQNGTLTDKVNAGKHPGDYTVSVASAHPGESVTYEVTLPSWANVALLGLTLEDGYGLEANPVTDRPIYAAFGDSITHGTGQGSRTFDTYPYQLARRQGWELYNFAIGGSTTTPELAYVLDDAQVDTWLNGKPDIISVLWGYNDRGNQVFTLSDFRERYTTFVESLVEECPDAVIFCISPLTTTVDAANDGSDNGKKIADYRVTVQEIVASMRSEGYDQVFFINGEPLVEGGDLLDGVHLKPSGADKLAGALQAAMQPVLTPDDDMSGLEQWKNGLGMPGAEPASDEDFDGLPLIFEYMLDANPWSSDAQYWTRLVGMDNSSRLFISLAGRHMTIPDDLSVVLEGSDDLGLTEAWTPVETDLLVAQTFDGRWSHSWVQAAPVGEGGRRFVRLSVVPR